MISADQLRRQPRAKTGSPFYSKRITSRETSTPPLTTGRAKLSPPIPHFPYQPYKVCRNQ